MTPEELDKKLFFFWQPINEGTASEQELTKEIVSTIFDTDSPDTAFLDKAMKIAIVRDVAPVVKALAARGVELKSHHLYSAAIAMNADLVQFMMEKNVVAPRDLHGILLSIAKDARKDGHNEQAEKAKEIADLVKTAPKEGLADFLTRRACENLAIRR